jgi:hypothetical protein
MLAVEEEAWSADRMTFRVRALGQVAAGWVDVADDHVQLEVTLPWLLHRSGNRQSPAVVAFCLKKMTRLRVKNVRRLGPHTGHDHVTGIAVHNKSRQQTHSGHAGAQGVRRRGQ